MWCEDHLTFPLRVTAIPSGWFSLILKVAIAFFARVFTGLWPVISAKSFTAASRPLEFCAASPIPQFTTIFLTLGTYPNSNNNVNHVKQKALLFARKIIPTKCMQKEWIYIYEFVCPSMHPHTHTYIFEWHHK